MISMSGERLRVESPNCFERRAAGEFDETDENIRWAPPSRDDMDCAVFIVEMIGGRLKVKALSCLKRGASSEDDETGETDEGLSCLDESKS